jgi:hypothetical protein
MSIAVGDSIIKCKVGISSTDIVPHVASVSGLAVLYWPFGFLWRVLCYIALNAYPSRKKIMKKINSDSQQFHQYQQKEQSPHII